MKYLIKFNESQKGLSEQDILNIENLFLDWFDNNKLELIHHTFKMYQPEIVIKLDLINNKGPFKKSELEGYAIPMDLDSFATEIDMRFDKSIKVNRAYYDDDVDFSYYVAELNSKDRIQDLFSGNLPNIYFSEKNNNWEYFLPNLLNYLDQYYDIKNQLLEILSKIKGINHYGFTTSSVHAINRNSIPVDVDGFLIKIGLKQEDVASQDDVFSDDYYYESHTYLICIAELKITKK